MNGANKNEVDLLLRSLTRGRKNAALQSGLASGGERVVASDHLDADELNSYAEGVVPDPARVRYTEHLADCATCRSIVVGLSHPAGAASRQEVAERNESSLWQKLAALLSPSVLRFAVPALVLTLVIGIGFFALRQQSDKAFVAENRPQSVQPSSGNGGAVLNPASEPSATVQTRAEAQTAESTAEDKSKKQDKKLEAGQTSPGSDSSLAKAAPAKAFKDAEEAGAGTSGGEVADLRTGSVAQPKVAEPPPPVEAEKSADFALSRPAKRADQERSSDELRNQSEDIHGPNRGRNNAPMSTSQRAVGGLMNERGPSAVNKNSKNNELETRNVLGKRFTRPGAVWIDTDYDSQATIKLSRGSEQFRALVADEPGIRTIAERLDGAIIVVWKGRAYRIQ